jgi:membrane-bound lytic murein transglycosylase B
MTDDPHGPVPRAAWLVGGAILAVLVGVGIYVETRPAPPLLAVPAQARVAAAPKPADGPSARPGATSGGSGRAVAVSPRWVDDTAAATGVPAAAVRAYGAATLLEAKEDPACHLGWTTLAGVGWVESQQGTIDGRTLRADGTPSAPITGPSLDGGNEVAAIPDAAGGWARALGPMQFIPSTWEQWAVDGDGDGRADPQDIDDAAVAAAHYLCASGGDLATGPGWSAAIYSYNHSADYVRSVYDAAQAYATRDS